MLIQSVYVYNHTSLLARGVIEVVLQSTEFVEERPWPFVGGEWVWELDGAWQCLGQWSLLSPSSKLFCVIGCEVTEGGSALRSGCVALSVHISVIFGDFGARSVRRRPCTSCVLAQVPAAP